MLRRLATDAEIVLMGLDEAETLFGTRDVRALCAELFATGCAEVIALKDGGNGAWIADHSQCMENTDHAKTVQKPCTHGLQNKKAMKSFDFTAFSGAMEGTRTPGLLIRRNRMAHFVHFIIQR